MQKTLLIGYLGKEPEMKYTSGGTAIATFTDEARGGTTGRPSSRSSFLGNPDAKFSAENSARPQKAEKSPKRNSGFVVAWQMIPPLRGGDFQGITGLSSDDSFSVAGMRANGRKPTRRL